MNVHVKVSDLKTLDNESILGEGNIDLSSKIKETTITYTESLVPPENPKSGDEWFDLNEGKLLKRVSDGENSIWLDVSSSSTSTGQIKYTESPVEPENPIIGDEWYDPVNDKLFKRMSKNNVVGWYEIGGNTIYGDLIMSEDSSIIMVAPDGRRYRVTLDNDGRIVSNELIEG